MIRIAWIAAWDDAERLDHPEMLVNDVLDHLGDMSKKLIKNTISYGTKPAPARAAQRREKNSATVKRLSDRCFATRCCGFLRHRDLTVSRSGHMTATRRTLTDAPRLTIRTLTEASNG